MQRKWVTHTLLIGMWNIQACWKSLAVCWSVLPCYTEMLVESCLGRKGDVLSSISGSLASIKHGAAISSVLLRVSYAVSHNALHHWQKLTEDKTDRSQYKKPERKGGDSQRLLKWSTGLGDGRMCPTSRSSQKMPDVCSEQMFWRELFKDNISKYPPIPIIGEKQSTNNKNQL